jgi:hypothetical protein
MALPDEERRAELLRAVDDLLDRATELRGQWERIQEIVDARPRAAAEPEGSEAEETDPRLLIALDMALSGRTREEAEHYLNESFGSDGVEGILNTVFDSRPG